MSRLRAFGWLAVLVALGCGAFVFWPRASADAVLEAQARRYVSLGLALRAISAEDVDGYFGPEGLDADPDVVSAAALGVRLDRLAGALAADALSARGAALLARVGHLRALLGVIEAPGSLDFDTEGAQIFGVTPVVRDGAADAASVRALEALLPGPGSLADRVVDFRGRYRIAPDRRRAVFGRALAECRARTLAHWRLPAGERLDVEWTRKVPAAWHRFQGQSYSRLQINPDAVADPASAIDVACHEGYPGHHAQFVLMEARAGGLNIEDTLVLLRSPEAALREGAANYGVELAFAMAERQAFLRDVLFPMAGFAPDEAAKFAQVHRLVGQLSGAVLPILRDYRDGKLRGERVRAALLDEALISSPEALLGFFDSYGALVLGYTVAADRVRARVERADDRWAALAQIVATVDTSALSDGDGRRPDAVAGR